VPFSVLAADVAPPAALEPAAAVELELELELPHAAMTSAAPIATAVAVI